MQCLQPVDPDEQRQRIIVKYEHDFHQATTSFSPNTQRKTIHLLKHVNYAQKALTLALCSCSRYLSNVDL